MRPRLVGALLASAVLLAASILSSCQPRYQHKVDTRPECNVQWTGEIDQMFTTKVREDLREAHMRECKVLNVSLMSPGGSVIWSVEASQEIKRARSRGLIVEIHGRSLVASGALVVISAGSPGHRFIASNSLVVVHGVQVSGGFMEPPHCVDLASLKDQTDEQSRVIRGVLTLIVRELSENTSRPIVLVARLFNCGSEQIGSGSLLVGLNIADEEE